MTTFHKLPFGCIALGNNLFHNSFYSLMRWGWKSMDKSSLKLSFRHCGGLVETNYLWVTAWIILVINNCSLIGCAGAGTPRATPYMVHHKNRVNSAAERDTNHDDDSNDNTDNKQTQLGNHPRGINRLSSKIIKKGLNIRVGVGWLITIRLTSFLSKYHTVFQPLN